ncbi:NDP-sugar synthase [Candidatus Bathyarchaeota archaeon]|nr:NDP-sugar synthase [Candidatus Bathyarchaeota archaeon]
MKALVLAGGFGTRLRPLSCTRPKILFPILNKPLLQWLLEKMTKSNINEVILAVNCQTEFHIKQSKLLKNFPVKVVYSRDPPGKPLGTGGPLKRAERLLRDGDFLALNGDIFADIDYTKLLKFHEETGATATIALHRVDDPSRYGVVELDNDGKIKRFVEKPPAEVAPSNLINAGVYALSPKILDYIPRGRKVSIEREVFPRLAEEDALYGYVYEGIWSDIGKTHDYLKLNMMMLDMYRDEQNFNLNLKDVKIKPPILLGEKSSIASNSVIGPYVVLGNGVRIGRNVRIKNSVLLSGVTVSENTVIEGAVIGENAHIGKHAEIGKNCIIGDHAVIGDGVSLGEGVTVCPAKEVLENVPASKCII